MKIAIMIILYICGIFFLWKSYSGYKKLKRRMDRGITDNSNKVTNALDAMISPFQTFIRYEVIAWLCIGLANFIMTF